MPRQPGLFLTLVPLSFSTNESLDEAIARNVLDALREDIGTGDLTADLLRGSRMASTKAEALVLLREQGSSAADLGLMPVLQDLMRRLMFSGMSAKARRWRPMKWSAVSQAQ